MINFFISFKFVFDFFLYFFTLILFLFSFCSTPKTIHIYSITHTYIHMMHIRKYTRDGWHLVIVSLHGTSQHEHLTEEKLHPVSCLPTASFQRKEKRPNPAETSRSIGKDNKLKKTSGDTSTGSPRPRTWRPSRQSIFRPETMELQVTFFPYGHSIPGTSVAAIASV